MSGCLELIKEAFPEILAYTIQTTEFYLEYKSGAEEIEDDLQGELKRLNVRRLMEPNTQSMHYTLEKISAAQRVVYRLQGAFAGDFHFSGKGSARSIALVLYGLSREEQWINTLAQKNMLISDALCLSAAQQAAAAGLISNITENFQNPNDDIFKKNVDGLRSVIDDLCSELDNSLPIYSEQPVSKAAYDSLPKSRSFFSRRKSFESSSKLAFMLYGDRDFEEELKDVCLFLKDSQEFKEKVAKARLALYAFPFSLMEYMLSNDKSLLSSTENDVTSKPKPRKINDFILSQEDLNYYFREENEYYEEVGKRLLRKTFDDSLCTSVIEDICRIANKDNYFDARGKIYSRLEDLLFELNGFIHVKAENFKSLDFDWDKLLTLSKEDISSPIRQWDSASFIALKSGMRVPVCMWLCSKQLADTHSSLAATSLTAGSLVWAIVGNDYNGGAC